MSTRAADIATLDRWFPRCGPCALCGHRDARHRLWDLLLDMHGAGDSPREIARECSLPQEAIEAVLAVRPYKRERRAARPAGAPSAGDASGATPPTGT